MITRPELEYWYNHYASNMGDDWALKMVADQFNLTYEEVELALDEPAERRQAELRHNIQNEQQAT